MYEGEQMLAKNAAQGSIRGAQSVDVNPTVEENINNRIAILRAEIARLEASKSTLAPLLPMKIRDIRDAMNY